MLGRTCRGKVVKLRTVAATKAASPRGGGGGWASPAASTASVGAERGRVKPAHARVCTLCRCRAGRLHGLRTSEHSTRAAARNGAACERGLGAGSASDGVCGVRSAAWHVSRRRKVGSGVSGRAVRQSVFSAGVTRVLVCGGAGVAISFFAGRTQYRM